MRSVACLALLATAPISLASPAAAQDFSMMSNWAQGQMIQDNLQRNLRNGGHPVPTGHAPVYATGPGIRQPRNPAPGSVAIPIRTGQTADMPRTPMAGITTAYRSSPAITAQVRQQIIAVTAEHAGPEAARSYAALLDQQRPLDWWARKAANDGLHGGDVADAMAEYWVTAWQLVNGVDLTNPAQMRAVRRQVQGELTANPNFARMGDAQKQELAELFIYTQASEGQSFFAAKRRGDEVGMERIREGFVTSFQRQMHVDLRRLTLTETGFHITA